MLNDGWFQGPRRRADATHELERADAAPQAAFDRWTRWLTEVLGVRSAVVSQPDSDHDAVAVASMPVHAEGQVIGELRISSDEHREWSREELTLLRHAAEAISAELSLHAQANRVARTQRLVGMQAHVHRLIAGGAPLGDVLRELTTCVERELPGARAEIVLPELAASQDGTAVDAARWTAPIVGEDGEALGILAVTAPEAVDLDVEEQGLLADAAQLAAIAVERHQAHALLAYRATHDVLTGLPNRALLLDRLAVALARARRTGAATAVLFVDLDRFKLVNDSLGHDVGDELLLAVAQRLTGAVRASDTVARFGGDEFVVIAEVGGRPEAEVLVARILDALEPPVMITPTETLAVRASVGVTVVPAGGGAPSDALRSADIAMYEAKRAGGSRAGFFDEDQRERATARLRLENDLREAVARSELRIVLQPIVSLGESRPTCLEALARWEHPELGTIHPHEFIPVAEETGLIVDIGAWVLAEACAATVRLSAAHGAPLDVAVNLSPRQLDDPDLVARVRQTLEETGLEPARLALEITESALLDATRATRSALIELRSLGVRLVLDDFGTGFSSLATLRTHTVDEIKVDRSFVAGIASDADDRAIVAAIVAMAHALGCDVTGEGVEDEPTLARLRELGCDHAQGFLLSRPVGESALVEALATMR